MRGDKDLQGRIAQTIDDAAHQPPVQVSRENFNRVTSLVEGFESPFGLELLSTVHWVVTREAADTTDAVIERTYAWSERKKQFTERQIRLAVDVLAHQGWIERQDG